MTADLAVAARSAVGSDHEDVQRVIELRRPLAETGDDFVIDAVDHVAVLHVAVERAADQDDGQADRRPSGEHHAERILTRTGMAAHAGARHRSSERCDLWLPRWLAVGFRAHGTPSREEKTPLSNTPGSAGLVHTPDLPPSTG